MSLEEKTAVYPRVVVSTSLINYISNAGFRFGCGIREFDGLYYIDYLKSPFVYSYDGNCDIKRIMSFFQKIKEHINGNIERFRREKNRTHQLAKWQWLAYKFDEALGHWGSLFSNTKGL